MSATVTRRHSDVLGDFNVNFSMSSSSESSQEQEKDQYGNDDYLEAIESGKNENTSKKTVCDLNLLKKFIRIRHSKDIQEDLPEYSSGDEIQIEKLTPVKLNMILSNYFTNTVQNSGTPYQPNSLNKSQFNSFVGRYLAGKDYAENIHTSDKFRTCREALSARQGKLKAAGEGNLPMATRPLEKHEIDLLFEKEFSLENPKGLISLNYWNFVLHFGLRPGAECRNVQLSDISVHETAEGQYLQYRERKTKTRKGRRGEQRKTPPKMFSTSGRPDDVRDPVSAYMLYISKRPKSAMNDDSPFFLTPKQAWQYDDAVWYQVTAIGKNKLGGMLKDLCEKVGIDCDVEGARIRNHAIRKTLVHTLKENNYQDTDITMTTGHKNPLSIKHYSTLNLNKYKAISHRLSSGGQGNPQGVAPPTVPTKSEHPYAHSMPSFEGNMMYGCTINIHQTPQSPRPTSSKTTSLEEEHVSTIKRRRIIISDEDSSQD